MEYVYELSIGKRVVPLVDRRIKIITSSGGLAAFPGPYGRLSKQLSETQLDVLPPDPNLFYVIDGLLRVLFCYWW